MIFPLKKKTRSNLKSGNISGEAVNAEHHFPGALPLCPPRAAPYFAVVLPYPPSWIQSISATIKRIQKLISSSYNQEIGKKESIQETRNIIEL